MANTGKSTLSYRRKKPSSSTLQNDVITKDIKIAHEATAGDTSISFANLTVPSLLPNFSNPQLAEIQAANLKGNEESLIVVSSLRGTLICGVSYTITNTSAQMLLVGFAAAANEIFTIQVKTLSGSGTVLDVEDQIVSTGTLLAGQTDIPVGTAFPLNKNSSQQMGAVIVQLDGDMQLRNVNNATATPLADGNYEEVDAGNGESVVIRVNQAEIFDRSYSVHSSGPIVNTSSKAGLQQQIDSLAGQIDQMVPTLALEAGVPETDFQAQPNNVDLKAFSDKVFKACTDIDTIETNTVPLAASNENRIDVLEAVTTGMQTIEQTTTVTIAAAADTMHNRVPNKVFGDNIATLHPDGTFDIPAGKYDIALRAIYYATEHSKVYLYNVTDGVYVKEDANLYYCAQSGGGVIGWTDEHVYLNTNTTKRYQFRQWVQNAGGNSLSGTGANYANDVLPTSEWGVCQLVLNKIG